jgi:hypothetical protein
VDQQAVTLRPQPSPRPLHKPQAPPRTSKTFLPQTMMQAQAESSSSSVDSLASGGSFGGKAMLPQQDSGQEQPPSSAPPYGNPVPTHRTSLNARSSAPIMPSQQQQQQQQQQSQREFKVPSNLYDKLTISPGGLAL